MLRAREAELCGVGVISKLLAGKRIPCLERRAEKRGRRSHRDRPLGMDDAGRGCAQRGGARPSYRLEASCCHAAGRHHRDIDTTEDVWLKVDGRDGAWQATEVCADRTVPTAREGKLVEIDKEQPHRSRHFDTATVDADLPARGLQSLQSTSRTSCVRLKATALSRTDGSVELSSQSTNSVAPSSWWCLSHSSIACSFRKSATTPSELSWRPSSRRASSTVRGAVIGASGGRREHRQITCCSHSRRSSASSQRCVLQSARQHPSATNTHASAL
eukprot:scaffold80456_cov78-Phaeocystis_antarctica.AAC.1